MICVNDSVFTPEMDGNLSGSYQNDCNQGTEDQMKKKHDQGAPGKCFPVAVAANKQ